jgi:hypothetical protein
MMRRKQLHLAPCDKANFTSPAYPGGDFSSLHDFGGALYCLIPTGPNRFYAGF